MSACRHSLMHFEKQTPSWRKADANLFTYRCLCMRSARVELYLLIVAVRTLFVVYHIEIN